MFEETDVEDGAHWQVVDSTKILCDCGSNADYGFPPEEQG